jgi:16S rRNA (uracil1498-N3)-methyltransferase
VVSDRLRRFPLVFVDDLVMPEFSRSDLDHLVKSLRFSVGDELNLSDGSGSWVPGVLTGSDGSVEITGIAQHEAPPQPELGVAFAATKGVKVEGVAKKLTELGINRIAILESARSVVTYDTARAERLMRKISVTVREACQQSRQPHLPTLEGLVPIDMFVARHNTALLAEPGAPSLQNRVLPVQSTLWVAVGPEGGWTDSERESADTVGLPGGILRADTATIAAGVVLAAHRDRIWIAN